MISMEFLFPAGATDLKFSDLAPRPRNFYVKKHNDNILSQLPGEKSVITCHDNVVSANIPAKECQRLINSLPDDY